MFADQRQFLTTPQALPFARAATFCGPYEPVTIPDDLRSAFAPATHCLREWSDYLLECPGADCLYVGDERLPPETGNRFRLRFENELGLVTLQPFAGAEPLSERAYFEVISPKFPTPSDHLAFYRTLLADLFARSARLPFAVSARTARGVAESLRPPTPLFTLHFLCQSVLTLRTALLIVCAAPHRLLSERAKMVALPEASEIDADVLTRLVQEVTEWSPASQSPLAQRLHGHVPRRVWQRQLEDTFDTVENRFVLDFLRQMLAAADGLPGQPWWENVPSERQKAVRGVANLIRQGIREPMFLEVGRLHHLPTASQVLQRREGYRDFLTLWQKWHHARRPLFAELQHAIDVRDIAKLYEIWVFFALTEEVAVLLNSSPAIDQGCSDETGLRWQAQALFGPRTRLVYNRTWSPNSDAWRSYSVSFRPDITWIHEDRAEVVLDAKFRLDRWVPEGGDDEDSVEATARRADLYKMHTYRDALHGVRAAICVYPGDESVFYERAAQRNAGLDLRSLLLCDLQGIGALARSPESKALTVER